jgi:hypothetical protein
MVSTVCKGEKIYFFRNIILKENQLFSLSEIPKNASSADAKERTSQPFVFRVQKGYQTRLLLESVLLLRSWNVECLAWWIGTFSTNYQIL